ncbi:putative tail component [Xenorhabdus nematophila F1]|uniref:tape measure protein n=1 Tax=Xenorhabdus nematophila TaxID=628 RepID=UPI00032758AC|nr:tape measure protein [Xenorhabdus nematophila]CCW31109.1 putative tail component [Xenorhabdus nematophila F1]
MAKLRELIIKISANSSSYQAEIARAARLGENYHRVMENGNRSAAAAARGSSAALRDLNNQLVSVKESAMGMAGAFAGIFATSKLIETADKWTNLNSRLKLATASSIDLANSQRLLMEMSQKTGTSFEANTTVFARAAAPMRALQYATRDVVNMTEALATGLKISGANASESSSVLVQFSQAMSSGVLRGEEFNAMAENGGRLIQALADGMGVARTQLKGMANDGLLTMDKVIPALLSQLGKLQDEYSSMGATVEKSMARVQNAFMEWVGGANESSSTTKVLAGALDSVSRNIDTLAMGLGALVAVGAARFFGGVTNGAINSARGVFQAYRAEVALADAQVRGTQIAVARSRARVYNAQQAVIAAKNTDMQTVAENRLATAQAILTRNIAARTAAQTALNSVTSAGSRLASVFLGFFGGIPGLLMLGAGAAYMLYQNHKQANEEALEYAKNVESVKDAWKSMTLNQLSDETGKIKRSVRAIKNDLDDLQSKKEGLQSQIENQRLIQKNPNLQKSYGISLGMSQSAINELNKQILLTQEKINEKTAELNRLKESGNDLADLYNQKMDEAVQKTENNRFSTERIVAEFNRMPNLTEAMNANLSFGVNKLDNAAASALAFANNMGAVSSNAMAAVNRINLLISTMKAPELSSSQSSMMDKQIDRLELSKHTGRERQQKQLELDAKNNSLPTPYADSYIAMGMQAYDNEEATRKRESEARKAQSEAESAARKAAKTAEDYAHKVAELNTQLATEAIRYKEGNAAAELFSASMQSGKNFTKEQNAEIGRLNKTLEEAKQKYQDLQDAISNDPFRSTAESAKKAREQLERQFKNKDVTPEGYERRKGDIWKDEVRGRTNARQQYAVSARDDLRGEVDPIQDLENQFERKKALYQSYADATVISEQRKNELILAAERDTDTKRFEAAKQLFASQGDLQSLAVTMFETTQERMGNMITGLLTGSKSLREGMSEMFASLAQDVVKSLIKMATQALITNTIMKSLESAGGGGGIFSGFTSLFTKNAKGGVYNSPSLSSYSGQIVNSPTLFAFAKGAGLMGEAGPEAIMPLTRGADGSLGVRVITPKGLESNGKVNISVYITDGKADSSASKGDNEAFGRRFAQAVAQVYYAERDRDLRQGGAINKAIRAK